MPNFLVSASFGIKNTYMSVEISSRLDFPSTIGVVDSVASTIGSHHMTFWCPGRSSYSLWCTL